MSGINNKDGIYSSLSVKSKVVVDNNFNLKVNDARINGNIDVKGDMLISSTLSEFIRPFNFASNSMNVPSVMSQQTKISDYTNMRIKLKSLNDRGTFDFTGLTGNGQTYQFWINYYNETGGTLTKSFMSTAFDPETIVDKTVPSGMNLIGNIIEYDIVVSNIYYEKPSAAKYWSFTMRVEDNNFGVSAFDGNLPIESYYVTPFY